MAKTDKTNKKCATKRSDPIEVKPAVPASAKEILAKATPLSKPSSRKAEVKGKNEMLPSLSKSVPTPIKKTAESSDESSDTSSSEESSSEESDTSNKKMPPVRGVPSAEHRKVNGPKVSSGHSSSEVSSSEESNISDDDNGTPSVRTRTSPRKVNETSDSEDDSSSSGSEESSSESDSNKEEDNNIPLPAQTALIEAKKRKADNEAVAPSKKAKVTNDATSIATAGEETRIIFVGKLSWNVDNDWLAQEFAECGEVESAYVQMDRNTGRSRGFGYVHFKTTEALEKALTLKGKEIDGRLVNIDKSNHPDKKASAEKRAQAFGDTRSPPSNVLFVGNLSFSVNEDALWETFGEHGDIKNVRVPTDRETGRPKGFGYVEFSEVNAAKEAYAALQGYEFEGRSIRLDFSQPRDTTGGTRGGQGGRGGRGGRGRGFSGEWGHGAGRGGRGGDRGARGRGRGRGMRLGGITQFEGQKITFD